MNKLSMKKLRQFVNKLKYDSNGLIPVIAQDYKDGMVLMVAFMNRESLLMTLRTGFMCYYSRSRKKLWKKGETSGNVQQARQIMVDCDSDCLLFKIKQIGKAACHTGYRSCFYRKLNPVTSKFSIAGKRVFNPDTVYKK